LLVVIGVVVVLMALLLPAVAKARRQALQVACSSNLHQLGVAFIGYASDNRGWFPQPASGMWGPYPDDWIYWQQDRDITESPILRYVGNNLGVLTCPAGLGDRVPEPYQQRTGLYNFSYAINIQFTAFGRPWRGGPPCPLGKVFDPCHKILAVEEDSALINDGAWWPSGMSADEFGAQQSMISVRHDMWREYSRREDIGIGRGNVVFADGHCGFMERRLAQDGFYTDPFIRRRGPS
jgi:prepilin-type processing-associated H-X9-DG protein